MAKYLKLGPKASMFFDPNTQLQIRGNEVIELERFPKTKKITLAMQHGHLVRATAEEFEAYTNGTFIKEIEEVPAPTVTVGPDPLLELDDEDFAKKVKTFGFLAKDKKMILAAKTREEQVALYRNMEKNYE